MYSYKVSVVMGGRRYSLGCSICHQRYIIEGCKIVCQKDRKGDGRFSSFHVDFICLRIIVFSQGLVAFVRKLVVVVFARLNKGMGLCSLGTDLTVYVYVIILFLGFK